MFDALVQYTVPLQIFFSFSLFGWADVNPRPLEAWQMNNLADFLPVWFHRLIMSVSYASDP
jgi:hypothetical protein